MNAGHGLVHHSLLKRDQLLGRIQERHGVSRDEAETQVAAWENRDGRTPAALWMEKI